ncbi:MAG TPA: hypothetical protein VFT70_02630 [Nocardioides sp.]|nr:hypothetical protein [Nocardioides sp.]
MTDAPPLTRDDWSPRLVDLHAAVQRSRVGIELARRPGSRARDLEIAQAELLTALEHFDEALRAAGTTLPQQLRHEMELLRGILRRG